MFLGGRAPVNRVQEGTAQRKQSWVGGCRQRLLAAAGSETWGRTDVSLQTPREALHHLFKETNNEDLHSSLGSQSPIRVILNDCGAETRLEGFWDRFVSHPYYVSAKNKSEGIYTHLSTAVISERWNVQGQGSRGINFLCIIFYLIIHY